MEHLFEVIKIMHAALDGDKTKCAAYANLLADNLEKDGESTQARLLRDSLAVLEDQKQPVYVIAQDLQSPGICTGEEQTILEHAADLLEKEAQGYEDCCKDSNTGEVDWDSGEAKESFNDLMNTADLLRNMSNKVSIIDSLIKNTDPDQFKKRRALVAWIAYDGFSVVQEEKQLLSGLTEFLDEIADIAKNVYGNDSLAPTMFLNHCRCTCHEEYQDLWFWPMDNTSCPKCGADEIKPFKVDELSLASCDLSTL